MALVIGISGCRKAEPDTVRWGNPNTLRPNTVQHQTLPAAQIERIKILQQTFREFDPTPLDKWIEDFRRDRDPEREIRSYEGMAEAYRAYCSKRTLTSEARRDVYQIVLLRSSVPDQEVLSHLTLKTLSKDEAKKVLAGYKMPPMPILVEKR